ncbi:hypothetical protein ACYCS5_28080 [Paenibacillus sp. SEL3]
MNKFAVCSNLSFCSFEKRGQARDLVMQCSYNSSKSGLSCRAISGQTRVTSSFSALSRIPTRFKYTSFQEAILKYKNAAQQLPLEFMVPDRTRIHFVVVAGRRTDFKEKTYRTKRRTKTEQNIELLHYDNLYDTAKEVVGKATY